MRYTGILQMVPLKFLWN